MVSHSFHTSHELLILMIRVTDVSFAIESFVTYDKRVDNVRFKENFPTSKTLVIFLSK